MKISGGRSSVGRAPDCGSGCRGFEPHRSPQSIQTMKQSLSQFLFFLKKQIKSSFLLFVIFIASFVLSARNSTLETHALLSQSFDDIGRLSQREVSIAQRINVFSDSAVVSFDTKNKETFASEFNDFQARLLHSLSSIEVPSSLYYSLLLKTQDDLSIQLQLYERYLQQHQKNKKKWIHRFFINYYDLPSFPLLLTPPGFIHVKTISPQS